MKSLLKYVQKESKEVRMFDRMVEFLVPSLWLSALAAKVHARIETHNLSGENHDGRRPSERLQGSQALVVERSCRTTRRHRRLEQCAISLHEISLWIRHVLRTSRLLKSRHGEAAATSTEILRGHLLDKCTCRLRASIFVCRSVQEHFWTERLFRGLQMSLIKRHPGGWAC